MNFAEFCRQNFSGSHRRGEMAAALAGRYGKCFGADGRAPFWNSASFHTSPSAGCEIVFLRTQSNPAGCGAHTLDKQEVEMRVSGVSGLVHWMATGEPPEQAILKGLSLKDLARLSQVSRDCRDAVFNHLAKNEQEAKERIATLEGRPLSGAEWGRTRPLDPNHPALSYMEGSDALAFAKPGTVTAEITPIAISHDLEQRRFRACYGPHGHLVLIADGIAVIRSQNGEIFNAQPPSGWSLMLPSRASHSANTIIDRSFTCLARNRDHGELALLTWDPDNSTRWTGTPLVHERTSLSRCSANGRFVLSTDVFWPNHYTRLYDTQSQKEFVGSLPLRYDPSDDNYSVLEGSVSDAGEACLACAYRNVKLTLPQSEDELTLKAQGENTGGTSRHYFQSPSGDIVVSEEMRSMLSKGLVVQIDKKAILLQRRDDNPTESVYDDHEPTLPQAAPKIPRPCCPRN